MPLAVVVGGFFGDEGKGKVVSYLSLADRPSIAVRTGSINAGHTVVYGGRVWRLRIVPSAFLCERTRLLVAPGALIRLDVFFREVEETGTRGRVFVDGRTGVIEEWHVERERADAFLVKDVGSTLQGVGYAAADRVLRKLRLASDFDVLAPYLTDVPKEVNEALDRGERVIVEGTQGTFLSLYHGTYPYVTSRDTTASGVLSEVGVGPKRVDDVIVVFKSFVTRVGQGPLEGEIPAEEAERLGFVEVGTVTGRRRRVAPFNVEMARRAVAINSATQVALTKVDALFPEARCVRSWDGLPLAAKAWIESLENAIKVPITIISTGDDVLCTLDRRREVGLV